MRKFLNGSMMFPINFMKSLLNSFNNVLTPVSFNPPHPHRGTTVCRLLPFPELAQCAKPVRFLGPWESGNAGQGSCVADIGQWYGWCRQVLWPMQASIFTDTGQWYGWVVADACQNFCWHRPVFLMIQVSDVANAGQNFFWHRPVILLELWPMQARIFADTGQWYCWSCGQHRPVFLKT